MKAWETTGYVEGGVLKIRNRKHLAEHFKTWRNCEVVVRIEKAHAIRSLESNALYWAGFVHPLSEFTGYTPSEIHAYLKKRFLPNQHMMITNAKGEIVDESDIEPTTTKLNKVEFSDYLRDIKIWALEDLGLELGSLREMAS